MSLIFLCIFKIDNWNLWVHTGLFDGCHWHCSSSWNRTCAQRPFSVDLQVVGARPLTWTGPGSADTGPRPILGRRRRIRWCIPRTGSSCRTVSPGRRAWTARSRAAHTPPGIGGPAADRSGWRLRTERVESHRSPQDPCFHPPSPRPGNGPLGSDSRERASSATRAGSLQQQRSPACSWKGSACSH